jgi:HSP20 family molecular chaperone IbpA
MVMSENNLSTPNNQDYRVERMERRPAIAPPVDIYENVDEILVVADVPGANPDGIAIRLEKNELSLHARRDEDGAVPNGRAVEYVRTFLVPNGINGDAITAEMNAGVLRIRLPKSEAVKPRKIEVRVG